MTRPLSQRHLAHFANPPIERGQPFPLSSLKNKVVLVVNTASKCGFTPQFAGLEALYKDLKKQYPNDIEIIGFPCNQFGGQDPGSNDDIQEFCQINYGVSFPVLGKIDVCIPSTAPAGLLSAATAE
jgi:glutathione peroxidase-family protein